MKKLCAILLALMLVLSLTACGGGDDNKNPSSDTKPPSSGEENTAAPDSDTDKSEDTDSETQNPDTQQEEITEANGFLATKTGKFYKQFSNGRMYMEYETKMEGQTITIISATAGGKSYSETKMDGVSMGVSIMDDKDMYTIDHANKMIIKMSLKANAQTIAGAILEESDVDMSDLKIGTREIDGKTYDTEEWIIEDAASILCFDGDKLAYMIGVFEGEEMIMKILETSDNVDDSLFNIPADYTIMEM